MKLGCLSFNLIIHYNFVSTEYLEKKRLNVTKFSLRIDIDKILVGIITCPLIDFRTLILLNVLRTN